jgi:transcriptional regulator with XRE-family HTH domain
MEALSIRLRELMKKHDLLTEQELSTETGIPQPTIHRILAGNTKVPRKAALKAFSDFFKVPLHTLLEPNDMTQGMHETISEPGTRVPLLAWSSIKQQLLSLNTPSNKFPYQHIVSFKKLEGNLFALILEGPDFEPRFSRGTILVFKRDKPPKNRDYVLLDTEKLPVMKQILIDGREQYVKALDADLPQPVSRLENPNEIVGVLIQSISEYGN